jgi:hypothetical protein
LGPVVSRLLAGTKAQLPTLPVRLQLLQVSVHASPQQTPSVQNPDLHSLVAPHAAPRSFFGAQAPAAQ